MKKAHEILKNITDNGMRDLTQERALRAINYAIELSKKDLNEMERVKNKLHEQVKNQSETIGMYQEICQEVFGEQNPLYVKQKIAAQCQAPKIKRHELMTKLEEIQNSNYNKFAGNNEADLQTREEIADLFERCQADNAENKYTEDKIDLNEIFRIDQPYSLCEVLKALVESADILLHNKAYDGDGWERLEYCYRHGKDIIQILEKTDNKHLTSLNK